MKKKRRLRMPNNYGGIVHLGPRRRNPFAVRITTGWTDDNKQQYKYIGYFEKETDALECLVEYNKNPYIVLDKKTTFKEVYDKWSSKHFEKISDNSKKAYVGAIKKCEPLYNIPIYQLKTAHFQDIVDTFKSKSLARAVKNVVSQIYKFAIQNDIVSKDYSSYITMPTDTSKKDKVPFTIEEINTLWNHQGSEIVDVFLILLYTGMRISELTDIEIKNVHFNERYMIGGLKTEAGYNRVIPIHKAIAPLIEKRLTNKKYLFQNTQGNKQSYRNLFDKLKYLSNDLKINHTFHEARHTFISQANRLNINPISIKRIVGHATQDDVTNDVYTHKTKEDLIDAIDSFHY